MSYKIGSFNMYKFSNKSDKETKKDLELIAKIIGEEAFDIIAMQEVYNERAVSALVEKLNANWGTCWDYRWASPKKSSDTEAEGYAFVWNTNTMELSYSNKVEKVGDLLETVKHTAEPHIFDQYRIDRKQGQFPLARNPYYGRFKPKNCFCELRLINTHIRFGKDENEHYSKIGSKIKEIKTTGQRHNEFKVLSEVLYNRISNKVYGNNMPSYTILLGDYNLNLNRTWNDSPYIPSNAGLDKDLYIVYEVQKGEDNKKIKRAVQTIKTVQQSKTTLKQSEDNTTEDEELRGFANNYDHFSYDRDRFMNVYAQSKRIDTVRKYSDDDFAKHRLKVSDHVPITLNLDLKNDEDIEYI